MNNVQFPHSSQAAEAAGIVTSADFANRFTVSLKFPTLRSGGIANIWHVVGSVEVVAVQRGSPIGQSPLRSESGRTGIYVAWPAGNGSLALVDNAVQAMS